MYIFLFPFKPINSGGDLSDLGQRDFKVLLRLIQLLYLQTDAFLNRDVLALVDVTEALYDLLDLLLFEIVLPLELADEKHDFLSALLVLLKVALKVVDVARELLLHVLVVLEVFLEVL